MKIFKNVTFYNELFEKEAADIEVKNGVITAIGSLDEDGLDMSGYILIPGFVDIHIHGRGVGDFCDGTYESLDKISSSLAKCGVTSFCGTTMTLPQEMLIPILKTGKEYSGHESGSKLVGVHLEGPFIDEGKKGAQNGEYIRKGTLKEFIELYKASGEMIKIITVSPGAFDSDDIIKSIMKYCTVSLGHTNADTKTAKEAFSQGATHVTHLFNAMPQMMHRTPGVAGAALDSENVMCELICDGIHVHPVTLRNTFKILGENRACVVSDSMRGAGMGEGTYTLGGQDVFVRENESCALLADGTLAASVSSIYDEFRNLIDFGIPFKTVLKSCTINPAKAIKMENQIGSISVGKSADLVFLDKDLNIREVYINGNQYCFN